MKNTYYNLLLLLFGLIILAFWGACGSSSDPTPGTTPTTPTLTSITVTRTSGTGIVEVPTGGTLNLSSTYTVTPTPSTAKLGTLTWTVAPKTDSSATATIDDTILTAGAMTLTVKSGTCDTAPSDTIDISISATPPPPLTGINIGDPTDTLALGTDVNLGVLVTPEPPTANIGTLTWSIPTNNWI